VSAENPNTKMGHLSRNGLQIIAALVRMEARSIEKENLENCPLNQLADRLDAIILTHKQIDPDGTDFTVQLEACIRSIVKDRHGLPETDIQVAPPLSSIKVQLDKAVPVMLLFAEVLSIIGSSQEDLTLENVLLSEIAHQVIVITLRYDGNVEGFDRLLKHQIITLIGQQLGAKLSQSKGSVDIQFDL